MSIEVGIEEISVEVFTPSLEVTVDILDAAVIVEPMEQTTIVTSITESVISVSVPTNVVGVSIINPSVDVILSGPPGKEGTIILNGDGPPAASLGQDSNYYLDNTNDVLYGPKVAGTWPIALDPPGEVTEHEAKVDPHIQYLKATHATDPDPHPQYLPDTHLTDPDPHPQYLPDTHLTDPNPHPQYLQSVPVYTYTQAVLSNEWIIRHNLNKRPVVIIEDAGGSIIYGSITYMDNNWVRITFAFNATGKAHFT